MIPNWAPRNCSGRKILPSATPTRVIGFYAHGCIAGAEALPINGDTWQVMRLSRNRNWAHPDMVALLERLSAKVHKDAGWPGILSATCRNRAAVRCSPAMPAIRWDSTRISG